jgi:polysaccharide chain length determinant protein (PEP-CTERM system associated)
MDKNQLNITPEFVLELVLRRRWFILTPLCLALVCGIYVATTLPRIYKAQTLILIEPQRVPQNYVQPLVSEEANDRINTLSQQIMSRTNLEKIITDFNLFSGPENAQMYDEDKIRNLSNRINVSVTRDRKRGADAFSISFKGREPRKVMQVTNALANSFIDENLKVRESRALGTSDFLDAELDSMRNKLEQVEEGIKEYRKNFMGELPEQLDTNLRILDRLQDNLNERKQSIRSAKTRLADLNSQVALRPQQVVVIGPGDQRPNPNDGSASLEELQAQLDTLSARYTQKHPDIMRLKKLIAERESKQAAIFEQNRNNKAKPDVPVAPMSPQLRLQISEVQRDIQLTQTEIETLNNQILFYQKRVENTPKREQELLSLRRDYQNIQGSYDSLLKRKLEADIAVNMERKQKGEQFRILDPARLPQKPVSPDLKKIFLMAVAGGLGIGGGIAFLLEFFNTSFRKPDDIESSYGLPVLVTIPRIYKARQKLYRKIEYVGSVATSLVAVGLFGFFAMICLRGA